jgi:hypothetical protein
MHCNGGKVGITPPRTGVLPSLPQRWKSRRARCGVRCESERLRREQYRWPIRLASCAASCGRGSQAGDKFKLRHYPRRRGSGKSTRLSPAFRNVAGQWDTTAVPSHRGGAGCSVIRKIASRRRCGGPLRAAEAACRLCSLGGTLPPRRSAVLSMFSAMVFAAFAHRTVSTTCVTSLRQQRSAGARMPARPTVNALPSSRAPGDRLRPAIHDFSLNGAAYRGWCAGACPPGHLTVGRTMTRDRIARAWPRLIQLSSREP